MPATTASPVPEPPVLWSSVSATEVSGAAEAVEVIPGSVTSGVAGPDRGVSATAAGDVEDAPVAEPTGIAVLVVPVAAAVDVGGTAVAVGWTVAVAVGAAPPCGG